MRMLKKFFLGACIIGLIGVCGFAGEAKAAVNVSMDVAQENVMAAWDNSTLSANQIEYKIGTLTIAKRAISSVSSDSINVKDAINTLRTSGQLTSDSVAAGTVEAIVTGAGGSDNGMSTTMTKPLYKLSVDTNGDYGYGIAMIDGTYSELFDYENARHTISAQGAESDEGEGYVFGKWNDGNTDPVRTDIYVQNVVGKNKYTANFNKAKVVFAKAGTFSVGQTVKLGLGEGSTTLNLMGIEVSADGYIIESDGDSDYFKYVSSVKTAVTAKCLKAGKVDVNVTSYFSDGTAITSKTSEVTITNGSSGGNISIITEEDSTEGSNFFATIDKTLVLKAKNSTGTVTWSVENGSGKAELPTTKTGTSIELKATGVGDVTVKATDDSGTVSQKIEIVDKPTLTYDNRALKYKIAAKVNTGKDTGVDSDNKDSTKTAISEVKGVKLQVLVDGNSLGTTSTAKTSGTGEQTISASTVEQIITNLKSKFNNTSTVTFRAYPCDSDGKYNKNVYADATATVYKVTVQGTGIKTETYYGLSGQSLTITATPTDDKVKFAGYWDDDKTITTASRTITVSEEKTYTAVMDAAATMDTDAASKYDKVPKTGQSNTPVYVMIALIVCASAVAYCFYSVKRKKNA